MRDDDLIDAFAFELEALVQNNADEWCSDAGRVERGRHMQLIGDARECDIDDDPESAEEFVSDLSDALQEFAPPYAYFGSHPGDGADYGFWVFDDIVDEFGGLKVSDLSEVPADYSGEVLHVNDHGNVTLYVANNGELSEVWGCV